MSERRFVYIMGRGHSGSTVLDGLIGNARDCYGTGELLSGLRQAEPVCSCGASLDRCPVWSAIRASIGGEEPDRFRDLLASLCAQSTIREFPRTLSLGAEDPRALALVEANRRLLSSIADQVGAEVVVDSGKEVTRALFLGRFLPNTRIVHLVRHPDSTANSLIRRMSKGTGYKFQGRRYYNQKLTPFFVAMMAATWTIGNLACEIVGWKRPGRVLRVEYEALCAAPPETLLRIFEFLDLDGSEVIERVGSGASFTMGHKIGGNGMRMQSDFRFDPQTRSGPALAWPYRLLIRLLTWPLLIRYGYGLGATRS